jgi:hypothetical protein
MLVRLYWKKGGSDALNNWTIERCSEWGQAFSWNWGQQLSSLSRVEKGIFRVTRENSSHIFGVETTIAIESGLSYPFAHTVSIP